MKWQHIVELLLKRGADCNTRSDDDKTPFELASDNEKFEIASLLSRTVTRPDEAAYLTTPSINTQDQRPDVAVQMPQSNEENEKSFENEELSTSRSKQWTG